MNAGRICAGALALALLLAGAVARHAAMAAAASDAGAPSAITVKKGYAPTAPPPAGTLTLVLVGDVGLNRSNTAVDARGVLEGPAPTPWPDLSAKIGKLIDGDLNFMNLETVVTDRNDLAAADKGQAMPFGFRSHPAGVRHLTDLGFNLVSGANNHAYDFGVAGVRDTVHNLSALTAEGRLHFAGIGLNREEASRPVELALTAGRIAFSALGIVTNNINAHRATADKPGTVAYRIDDDWREVTRRLGETKADFRILSIHYGEEKDVRADGRQLSEWRGAVDHSGVDLIVGHHAHVVRGIEIRHGAPIFYGLGNFMLRGARDMGAEPAFATCRDYGLLARVHLARTAPGGRLALRAIEIIPIHDMHRQPAPFADPEQARRRIEVVNVLSARLEDPMGAHASDAHAGDAAAANPGDAHALFAARPDGVGLYCVAGAGADAGAVGQLCRGWAAPPLPAANVQAEIMHACVREVPTPGRSKATASARGNAKSKSTTSAKAKAKAKDHARPISARR